MTGAPTPPQGTIDWQLDHQARVTGGVLSRTPETERLMADSYRLRTQAIADYMNAVPIPAWAGYLVAIGSALFGAGSAVLAATGGSTTADWIGTTLSWVLGLSLVVAGVLFLRGREEERHRKYVEGRALFDTWAKSVNQPFPDSGPLNYGLKDFEASRERYRQTNSGPP